MTEIEIKGKIVDLFNEKRESPNTNFNESHFLDFLKSPSYKKHTIKNSFKGARQYYRFMDAVELEFGICFRLSDLDHYYSVDSLTKKVLQRIKKGRGNLMILKQRNAEKEQYWIEAVLITILVTTYFWLKIHWFPILLTILFGIAIWWILSSKVNNKLHNKQLTLKILKEK
ncbi:hypothetical protein [Pedobacter psychrodurus]|uniref:hypothetical protein n=1 Tax=Pedobacter psychrodurus TaxID=2530456 RepID=UPI00292FA7B7|nr:hypothetical protein [Pedobacter psychrodurus]